MEGDQFDQFRQQRSPEADYKFLEIKTVEQLSSVAPIQVWEQVICLGDRVMIAGATKSFKSFFVKQFTYSIIYGIAFLERKIVTPVAMLDLDMELREYFCRQRIEMIAGSLNGGHTSQYRAICLRGLAKKLTPEAIKHLGQKMHARHLRGLVLDPIYKLERPGQGEIHAAEVNALLDPFDEMSFTYDLLFIWIHHHSKGDQAKKESHERASGSGAWSRYADVIVDLIAHKEDFCFILQITQRNFPAVERFVIQFNLSTLIFVRRNDLSPEDVRENESNAGRPKKIEGQIEIALAVVRAMDNYDGVSHRTWQELTMIPESSFKKVKKICIAQNKVYYSKLDDTFRITPKYKEQCHS